MKFTNYFCDMTGAKLTLLIFLLGSGLMLPAQDLEPRYMSMMPVKGNFIVASYAYSAGNILLDNALPIEDLEASIHSLAAGYARSFRLFGQLAKFDAVLPYSFGTWEGKVNQIDSSTQRIGFGDPLLRVSMMLIGGPALSPVEYATHDPKNFKLGIQFRVRAPLGQYDPNKLINLGLHRWSFKFGVGASYQIQKFILEASAATWIFTANQNYFGGNKLEQYPLATLQVHGTYVFKKGLWLAASFGGSMFGEISINDEQYKNRQGNTRYGLAFAFPITKGNGIKIAYTSGVSTRYGANFNSIILAYQKMWFSGLGKE